jgi:hypothetical protein
VTSIEAVDEARRRWGEGAGIVNLGERVDRCAVGHFVEGFFVVLGKGATWEEAFRDVSTAPPQPGTTSK